MALARFFDKTALAASHVLKGYNHQLFAETLDSKNILIFFDKTAENTREGKWTLELTVNLLARLYPKISIVSKHKSNLAKSLVRLAKEINPQIEIGKELVESSLCLVVGGTTAPAQTIPIYVGSDGWIAKVSTRAPVCSSDTTVPFGAGAAACIGVANLFRATFANQLEDARLDESWQVSLLDFDPANSAPANPQIKEIDFEETHLVGLGAIGHGCIWALSKMQELRGVLHSVDAQSIDLSNLQRYVLTNDTSVGRKKVDLAQEVLANTGLKIIPHPFRWGEYLQKRNNWQISRVAVAVDTAADRQAIQTALPKWIVNAWTQVGDLGVSRHDFIGDQACLACLYAAGPQKNEDELVAEAIGLPQDKLHVRKLLVTNEPLDRQYLGRISEAVHVDLAELMPFEGQPLRIFYTQAICGGVLLRLGAMATSQRGVEVPMAFQSALAGILLAAELVAKAANLKEYPPPVTTKMDLLHPLGPYLSLPAPKNPSGYCICQDSDYIAVFKEKYLER